jgi:hypothetical protein
LRRGAVVSLLVKCWGEPKECLRWRGHAALLEPRRKRRGKKESAKSKAIFSWTTLFGALPRWSPRASPGGATNH